MKYKISLACALGLASLSYAAPDAGSIQREIDIQQSNQPIQKPSQNQLMPQQQEDKVKVIVKEFNFTGNTLIPTEKLKEITQGYVGKELGFNGLKQVVAMVSDYYAAHGGLAKVYLPKQDITSGVITISIIEGKLNKVVIENQEAKLSKEDAEQYISVQQQRGTPISSGGIAAALLNINSLGGIKATSSLAPGEAEGSSDLIIKLKDTNKFSADIGADNYGSKGTGNGEVSGGVIVNDLSSMGLYDNLNVRALFTQGVRYVRGDYSVPVMYYGDKVGVSYSAMSYFLISTTPGGNGYSTTASVYETHPFIRSKELNLNWRNEYAYKVYYNTISNDPTSYNKINVFNSSLNYDQADNFLGGGQNSAGIGIAYGNLNLKSDMSNYYSDQAGAKTSGDYFKYYANATRLQALTEEMSLQLSIQGQLSNKNLDSSEQISLGGVYAVRSYPTGEASADVGYITSAELKYAIDPEIVPSVFFDYGAAKVNKDAYSGMGQNIYNLGGYGVGVSYTGVKNLILKAQVAQRTMTGYNPNNNGTCQDGSKLNQTRAWVGANYFF